MRRLSFSVLVVAVLSFGGQASCGPPTVIAPDVMQVVSIGPSHGTINISRTVTGFVFLSHDPVDATSATNAVSMQCVGTPHDERGCNVPTTTGCPNTPLVTTTTFDANNGVVRIAADGRLQAGTCYVLIVAEGLAAADESVAALPVEVRSSFETCTDDEPSCR